MAKADKKTEYEIIIGLEIHVQLKTKSKMFCRCDNAGEDKPANSTVCPVCMGHPGTLPVVNQQAIDWGVMAAMALNNHLPEFTKFDRKNYFYPDLPKGYQISQYDMPIGQKGHLDIVVNNRRKRVGITRVHLEEDAAKLVHDEESGEFSLVDFNRAGTPLLEIVTEPDMRSSQEARMFMQELRTMTRFLDISEANMERGQLRVDANISLRPLKEKKLFPKTEIKNLNSFRSLEKALNFEVQRQKQLWEAKTPPESYSTRGWNDDKNETFVMREKEKEQDYRYFPEPDLPPLYFDPEYLERIKIAMPELPQDKRERFESEYQLPEEEVAILTSNFHIAKYTEQTVSELKAWLVAEKGKDGKVLWVKQRKELTKLVANWIINKLPFLLFKNDQSFAKTKVSSENFAEFIKLLFQKKLNTKTANQVLEIMVKTGGDPSQIMEDQDLGQVSTKEIERIAEEVIKNNPEAAEDYKAGKAKALQFLMGQALKESKGKADPAALHNELLHQLK
ncbi:MAG: Asp-tRNA(Asn)/Glu-tRNA(Gln) amidotransferase subunit GatB [Patescibacteria group bacterium]